MKLIHITTKNSWIKIKTSGWLKRPIDLYGIGSTIHKDRIFFFLLSDTAGIKEIELLKRQVAKDKSVGDIGIGVIEYKLSDMLALELLSETFDPLNIVEQYIKEREMICELVGSKVEYYSVKEMIPIERLKVIDENIE